jgi:hypothetical protein
MALLLTASANGLSLPLAVGAFPVLVVVGLALVMFVTSLRRPPPR